MNVSRLKRPVLLAALIACFFMHAADLNATHLMGGSMHYKFIDEQANGLFRYRITIRMYRDCQQSNTEFDTDALVGIYNDNTSKTYVQTATLLLVSDQNVTPPSGGSDCDFEPDVCIREGIYQAEISLPPTNQGYHLLYQRCCRNNMVNLPIEEGQSYYSFIPPTKDENSSPRFNTVPAPYVCIDDTVTIVNTAIDDDGDSLVYKFAQPYDGASANDPRPIPGTFSLPSIPLVNYNSGYSENFPFGTSGSSKINSTNGLITITVPKEGLYALAFDVEEYRDGKLLSSTRRDIQIIALDCPPNNSPVFEGDDDLKQQTTFFVDAGDTIEFDISFSDSQNMSMTRIGDIFTGANGITTPLATLPEVGSTADKITSTFKWETTCEHAREQPYLFTVETRDEGCPPKSRFVVYTIYVNNFRSIDSIRGPDTVCTEDRAVPYSVIDTNNSLFEWSAIGGRVRTPARGSNVLADWEAPGDYRIAVLETNRFGCANDTLFKRVTVLPYPDRAFPDDRRLCSGDTITVSAKPSGIPDVSYEWTPRNYFSNPDSSVTDFTATNTSDAPQVVRAFLRITNKICTVVDTFDVIINPLPNTRFLNADTTPCKGTPTLYELAATSGSSYDWTITQGTIVSQPSQTRAEIEWCCEGPGLIEVLETNRYGCNGDTLFQPVLVDDPKLDTIYGSPSVCPNSADVLYYTDTTEGSRYFWAVDNGEQVAGANDAGILVDWFEEGSGKVSVYEINANGCRSDTIDFPVAVSYDLKTSPIAGDPQVCEFSTELPYSVLNTNGSDYNWSIAGGTIAAGNGTNAVTVDWGAAGNGQLKVLETAFDPVNNIECRGDTVYLNIKINPIPNTSPIDGETVFCENGAGRYSVIGGAGSVYEWAVDNDSIAIIGNGQSNIQINWQREGIYTLSVVETSEDSCEGPVRELEVRVNPNPKTEGIFGDTLLCRTEDSTYLDSVRGFDNSTYDWGITGGEIIGSDSADIVEVAWTRTGINSIFVQETSEYGCLGDTLFMPVQIDNLRVIVEQVTTLEDDEAVIGLQWRAENEKFRNQPYRVRRSNGDGTVLHGIYPPDTARCHDSTVNTAEQSYLYEVGTRNSCGDLVFSQPHNSIHLSASAITDNTIISANDPDYTFLWNAYINWPEGVKNYEVYRRLNDDETDRLYTTEQDTNVQYAIELDGYQQTYRIKAIELDGVHYSWSNSISFEFEPYIWIPNAFSPSRVDNLNDSFKVVTSNLISFRMEVYDRWGKLMFTTDDPDDGWDGRLNGMPCPEGAYVYRILYNGTLGKQERSGTITLLR